MRKKRRTARASCRGRTGARQGRLTVDDARAGRHESRGGSSDTHTHTHTRARNTHAHTQDIRPAAAPVREQTSALAHRRRQRSSGGNNHRRRGRRCRTARAALPSVARHPVTRPPKSTKYRLPRTVTTKVRTIIYY